MISNDRLRELTEKLRHDLTDLLAANASALMAPVHVAEEFLDALTELDNAREQIRRLTLSATPMTLLLMQGMREGPRAVFLCDVCKQENCNGHADLVAIERGPVTPMPDPADPLKLIATLDGTSAAATMCKCGSTWGNGWCQNCDSHANGGVSSSGETLMQRQSHLADGDGNSLCSGNKPFVTSGPLGGNVCLTCLKLEACRAGTLENAIVGKLVKSPGSNATGPSGIEVVAESFVNLRTMQDRGTWPRK